MRSALQRISSAQLAVLVAVTDITIWLLALPFELFCKSLLSHHQAHTPLLLSILVVNSLLVALIGGALVATGELVRRGLSRPVRVSLPVFTRNRTR